MRLADDSHNVFRHGLSSDARKRNRVFISHRMSDKPVARELARYFEFLSLHYYLDEEDEVLQQTVARGHSKDRALVEAIDHGLAHSTHVLAILSERTMGSWWVPYEVGSGRARNCDIAHLLLPPLSQIMVPEYLRIYPQLWKAEDVCTWAGALTHWINPLAKSVHDNFLERQMVGDGDASSACRSGVDVVRARAEDTYRQRVEQLATAIKRRCDAA